MTINVSPDRINKFQALREVLTIMKNNGGQLVTHNEALDFLFTYIPISKEVDLYMQNDEKNKKIIAGMVEKITIKGGK